MEYSYKYLEEHADERGILFEVLKDNEISENIKHIYFSTSKPGAIRGGHYHKLKVEWFCVIKGQAKLVLEDILTKEREEIDMKGDKPMIVKLDPGVSHAIKNVGDDEMYLIAISSEVFNPKEPDTYTAKLF